MVPAFFFFLLPLARPETSVMAFIKCRWPWAASIILAFVDFCMRNLSGEIATKYIRIDPRPVNVYDRTTDENAIPVPPLELERPNN